MNQALDRELARLSQSVGSSQSALLTEMVQYHLGLTRKREQSGKRLRANLALLTCEAFGKRILDTRDGTGGVPSTPLGPNASLDAQVAGLGGVPASGASAVVLNVT